MDPVRAHLKSELQVVAHDEGLGVVRAQRLERREARYRIVQGVVDGQHEPRDVAHGKRRIQLLGQACRIVDRRADQEEPAARLGRIDRLVQGAASGRLTPR